MRGAVRIRGPNPGLEGGLSVAGFDGDLGPRVGRFGRIVTSATLADADGAVHTGRSGSRCAEPAADPMSFLRWCTQYWTSAELECLCPVWRRPAGVLYSSMFLSLDGVVSDPHLWHP